MKFIVAFNEENYGIGLNGDMPWGLSVKEDLNFFRKITMGKELVMGNTTYQTLLKSNIQLDGRIIHVLTSNEKLLGNKPYINEIQFLKLVKSNPDLILAGGKQIYELGLRNDVSPYLSGGYISKIGFKNQIYECDVDLKSFVQQIDLIFKNKHVFSVENEKYVLNIYEFFK